MVRMGQFVGILQLFMSQNSENSQNSQYSQSSRIIVDFFRQSLEAMQKSMSSPELARQLQRAAEVIHASYVVGGTLFVAGNGGSAADAQHIAAELVAKFCRDRSSIRAFAMTVDTSLLTAIGNDYGYELSFSRQVEGLMRKGDVFLALSTSGNSRNILKALETCRARGITSILMSGMTGGKARNLADHLILAPSDDTRLIQETHLVLYHTLCQLIESNLVSAGLCEYRSATRTTVL